MAPDADSSSPPSAEGPDEAAVGPAMALVLIMAMLAKVVAAESKIDRFIKSPDDS